MTRQATRARILMIIGLALAASICASVVWASSQPPESWSVPMVVVGGLLLMFGTLAIAVMTGAGTLFVDPLSRAARFTVRAGKFRLEPLVSQGFTAMLQLMAFGFILGQWLSGLPRLSDPDSDFRLALTSAVISTAVVGVMTIATLVMIGITWVGGPDYELTTAGIRWRSLFASIFIPWEALYADGPPRPSASSISASQLQLAAVRPELVRYRGTIRARSTEWPLLPLATTTHPWLLADAIRWYAEHPEHRAGIGTQEEHDRLISTVTGDYPQLDERLRPPRPRQVTAAVWIGVAGAFAGVVLVAAILYIVGAFQGRMAEVFGPIAAAAWCGLVLVGAVLTLLAARGIRRASQRARVGMMVLSGLAALAGTFASPSRWLFDVPSELPHGMIVITLWVAHQSLVLATCAAVIVLLLLPPSSRYFKPPFRRGPELV